MGCEAAAKRPSPTTPRSRGLISCHLSPSLGRRKLRELSSEDVDKWLTEESRQCSTRTLRLLHSILSHSIRNAQARDKVRRNVVLLCDVPTGQGGRESKALTLTQAMAVINAAADSRFYAYIVLSLLIGARTEELRALRWCEVDLSGQLDLSPPVPPSISVLRSVRAGGDTKTRRSRRALAMPQRCVDALSALWDARQCQRSVRSKCDCLVFTSRAGTPLDAHNVRRDFRKVAEAAGLTAGEWTPRELRHSFVCCCPMTACRSSTSPAWSAIPARPSPRPSTASRFRPVIVQGAEAMDRIFRLEAQT